MKRAIEREREIYHTRHMNRYYMNVHILFEGLQVVTPDARNRKQDAFLSYMPVDKKRQKRKIF